MTKLQRGAVLRSVDAVDNFRVGNGTAPTPDAAAALAPIPTPIISISIQNDIGSPETLFVGNKFGQFRGIAAGGSQVISVCDLSLVYVHSVGGTATYNWMAGE